MKERIDELLNKYLDNELDAAELAEFTRMLEKDEELVKSLKGMKLVDQSLRNMELETSPGNVTFNVMQKLASVKKVKKSNWYFWFLITFFVISITATLFYTIKNYTPSSKEKSVQTEKVVSEVKDFLHEQAQSLNTILKNADVKLIGTILTLILIITGYLVFENHRSFKNKLKSL